MADGAVEAVEVGEGSDPSSSSGRSLRKRRIDLNRLASSVSLPLVCQFQHCGVRLADGDSLEWHYEGHLGRELERLDHIRVKKNPGDLPDRHTRRRIRDFALERIIRRRSRRQAADRFPTISSAPSDDLTCPACNLVVLSDEFSEHVDRCLAFGHGANDAQDEEEVDVDALEGVETYTWAGHTRVRATSLVQGGLRGAGFVSITRSDEDQELDIEGDEDNGRYGADQYTEADLILSQPETEAEAEDLESRTNVTQVLTGGKSSIVVSAESPPFSGTEDDKKDLNALVEQLQKENNELRQKSTCNICMDAFNTPLVSTVCWHVSCEECWMRALGTKKLCPQCKVIIQPKHLRRIFL